MQLQMRPQVLESPRLRLSPIGDADLEALHRCFIHPEIRRYLLDDQIIPPHQVAAIIARSEQDFSNHGYGLYGLSLRDPVLAEQTGLVGFCGCRAAEFTEGLELLFGLYPALWGKGLGSEAARQVMAHLFDGLQVDKVYAATDTPNQRSVRVLQRLGMYFDSRREFRGLDTVFYSLSRDEYLRRQRRDQKLKLA